MWNTPKPKRLARIPALGETDKVPAADKKIHLHFFIGGSDWYIAEYDGDDTFFGFCILNQDKQNAEWGYVSFSELRKLRQGFVEVDCEKATYFPVRKANKIDNIKELIK